MPVTAFDRYVASGGQRQGFWRVIAGTLLIVLVWIGGAGGVLFLWTAFNTVRLGETGARERLESALVGGDPQAVVVLLLSFAGIWAGVFLAVTFLHGQRFTTLFAPEGGVRFGELLKGLLIAGAFAGASTVIGLLIVAPATPGLPIGVWLAFLVPVIALIFLQATAEELLFRGYLLQQLAVRSRNPLYWAVLPSAAFGLLHWTGELPHSAAIYYAFATFLMGLALCLLVWRTGSLWAAIGVHVGFNVMGLTIVGAEGVLSGAQLFLFSREHLMPLMRVDLATTAALLLFLLSPWGPFRAPAQQAPADG